MNWGSIIEKDSERYSKIEEKLDIIANFFYDYKMSISECGLMSGNMGIVLFLAYYHSYKGCKIKNIKIANAIIDNTIYYANNSSNIDFTLSNGLSGLIWTINHLNSINKQIFNYSFDKQIFSVLHIGMNKLLANNNFDYLYGASGICSVFVSLFSRYKFVLPAIQNYVQYCTKEIKSNIESPSFFHNYRDLDSYYVFGLPHGFPAILVLLSKIKDWGIIHDNDVDQIINTGIQFFNIYQQEAKKIGSYYPNEVNIQNPKSDFSRLCWCYGDLSCCIALSHLNNDKNDISQMGKIKEILHFSTLRNSYITTKITEPCLCHGAAGIAHIFNRFYQSIDKDTNLKEAALYWFDFTIELLSKEDCILSKSRIKDTIKSNDVNFLNGIAGVGLSLLSSLGINPGWDEILFLNLDKLNSYEDQDVNFKK